MLAIVSQDEFLADCIVILCSRLCKVLKVAKIIVVNHGIDYGNLIWHEYLVNINEKNTIQQTASQRLKQALVAHE
ncbi:hypothetical protein A3197_14270 [Candidatus Thiodiazotropha endoloripes]|nr:hypothetical protein A3197_14270 [Candidatus Thiodiazotropha endoloripes]